MLESHIYNMIWYSLTCLNPRYMTWSSDLENLVLCEILSSSSGLYRGEHIAIYSSPSSKRKLTANQWMNEWINKSINTELWEELRSPVIRMKVKSSAYPSTNYLITVLLQRCKKKGLREKRRTDRERIDCSISSRHVVLNLSHSENGLIYWPIKKYYVILLIRNIDLKYYQIYIRMNQSINRNSTVTH